MKTRHAVITDNYLTWYEEKRKYMHMCPINSIVDAWEAGLYAVGGFTHLWIMPGSPADEMGGRFLEASPEYNVFATYEDDDTLDENGDIIEAGEKNNPMFARIYKKGTYGEVKIGWPHHGRWGWEIDAPVSILATIYYLEQVLGVPVEWSPGHMGTELVKHINRTERRQEWVRDSTVDLFTIPFKKSARDLSWKSPNMGDFEERVNIQGDLFLHQFDKRSAYMAACADLYVGAGDPVHVTEWPMNIKLPGIYRVRFSKSDSAFDDNLLPPIITTEWVTSDVLNYAIGQGYQVEVYEAWQWEEKHKTLANYAEKMYSSRRIFRDDTARFPHEQARENAENTMKGIALVSTGKFAGKKSSQFRQPYWWASTVGKARVIELANIFKIWDNTGLAPVLIYSDSVYYLSTDPNPLTAVPGIFDCGRKDGLGKFRHEGTWEVTAEMIEVFKEKKAGAVQKWLEHEPKINEVQ